MTSTGTDPVAGPASTHTAAANSAAGQDLPLGDTQDFTDCARGLIAPLPDGGRVRPDGGPPVWDLTQFSFVLDADPPDTVHPSLWRQTQLMAGFDGLFQVTDRVYQVRSVDLSNMTIIEGASGLIIVDPLVSVEAARAALDLYLAHRPRRDVVAVIYTHSHVDHYGGAGGVVSGEDVEAGRVRILAPAGFTEAALSENVMAGNVMSRRASYMYGNLLPTSPTGAVGSGLGLLTSTGTVGFVPPTEEIADPVQDVVIDGLGFSFLLAPDTEAPAEMMFHIPELAALCAAEEATHTLHNLYSLRGARTRDAKLWAHYLNRAIDLYGADTEVVFAQHHWPTWGNREVREFLEYQRDAYRYLHDQTLRLANHGYTMTEIAELVRFPASLADQWSARGYYGSVSHNVKAVYNLYLGFFDGNPATLHELPPAQASARYVEFMGGAEAVLARARECFGRGEYRWVAQVVNHVVFAEPANQDARALQADALEQLGYQSENGPWRNFYLTGAQELRSGVRRGATPSTDESAAAMPLDMVFDYLAIRLNGPAADGEHLVVNLSFTDTGEQHAVIVRNAVLHHTVEHRTDAAATVELPETLFRQIAAGAATLDGALQDGTARIIGRRSGWDQLVGMLDTFDLWFPIVEPRPAPGATR